MPRVGGEEWQDVSQETTLEGWGGVHHTENKRWGSGGRMNIQGFENSMYKKNEALHVTACSRNREKFPHY